MSEASRAVRESSAGNGRARPEVAVRYVPAAKRFEATVPGSDEVAFLEMTPSPDLWTFEHTEVPESMKGQGVGSELVRQALAHVRELGMTIKPVCPFTAGYIKRHPEVADLVHPDYRGMVR